MARLVWVLAVAIVGLVTGMLVTSAVHEASAQGAGVCDRTEQVRDAIVAASGAASCSDVTDLHHLREITSLDLSNQDIASLDAGDFEGLVRVNSLDLSGNSLTELPAGVFDPLYLLYTLRLDDNQLANLPAGIFDQLWLLEELTLSGNPGLAVADDLFGEFAELAGFLTDGTMPDNSGTYPRIQRFLTNNAVTSPEEFIEALPDLYKQRFSWVYDSKALAQDHVSFEHPRFLTWGADGRYIFAWNTDPDAPEDLLEVIEFLRQNDDDWTAGVIDFSGDTPSITEPTSCQTCHGSLNKPLWGAFGAWDGTEIPHRRAGEISEDIKAAMRAVLASEDSRIEPLDFDGSVFPTENPEERYLRLPGNYAEIWAVEEAGVIFSLRHTEVLFQRLKEREDYRQRAEETVCDANPYSARERALETFSENDHNPAVLVSTGEVIQKVDGLDGLARSPDYHYNTMGELGGGLIFLMVADLWEREPVVRHLYRTTSNEDTVIKKRRWMSEGLLYYGAGDATAEDELLWKLRQHFGNGNRASLSARAYQNFKLQGFGMLGAFFFDGHLEAMAPRVCDALRTSAPTGLTVAMTEGSAALSWQAPQYDAESLTGYRILRSVGGGALTPYVADTGTTSTTWVDSGPGFGEYAYAVEAIYDDHYASRGSNTAELDISLDLTFTATATDRSVHLTWDVPATAYVDDMYVERLGEGDAVEKSSWIESDLGGELTSWKHSDAGLDSGTTYRYRVKLNTEQHGVVYSDVLSVTTQSEPPLPPTGLSATATHDTVSLTWTVPEQPAWVVEPASLNVMRERLGGAAVQVDSVPWQQGVTDYSFMDTDVDPGRTYRYVIRANMGAGLHYSEEVSITTAPQPEDPDGTREGATVLDAEAAAESLQNLSGYSLNRSGGDSVDYYTFTTAGSHQLTFDVWKILGEGDDRIHRGVTLEDAQGNMIVESSPPPEGTQRATLDTAIGPGTYYVRFEAMQDSHFSYLIHFDLRPPPLTGFTLLDASTQTVLATLTDGDDVELADPEGGSYAIRAMVHADAYIGSVLLELSGGKTVSQTENYSPYSLYGDSHQGEASELYGETLPTGNYTLTATAYSERRLGGRQLAETIQVSFTVRGPNSPPAFGSATYAFPVAEDAALGAAVGSVSASDADNDTLTYTIETGNGDGAFAIDGVTGAVTMAGTLDYETDASYTLTVQADDGNGGTATATVNVTVTDVDESSTDPITGFTLVDASDQTVLATLSDGGSVALADPDNGSYAIRADLADGETVGSVRLELGGGKTVSRTENVAPYSLYGDGGENDLNGEALPAGNYTLRATAYENRSLDGEELGTLELSFTVTAAENAPGPEGPYRGQLAEVFLELTRSTFESSAQQTARHAKGWAKVTPDSEATTTSIVYVVDDSGSMDRDFPEVRTALEAVRDEDMDNTKVALIAFGSSNMTKTLFGLTSHSTAPWNDHIDSFGAKLDGTRYEKPLQDAKDLLAADSADAKKIVFFTDGQRPYPSAEVNQIKSAGIVVDTIAFGDRFSDRFAAVRRIATNTGGLYREVSPPSQGTTNNPAVTAESMADILKEAVAENTATLFLYDQSISAPDFFATYQALLAAWTKGRSTTGAQLGTAEFYTNESESHYEVDTPIGSSSLLIGSYGPSGWTDIDDALSRAFTTVSAATPTSRRVVLTTDGISATAVQEATLNKYKNDSNVTLYVVAWGAHADRVQLKTWADAASGTFKVAE